LKVQLVGGALDGARIPDRPDIYVWVTPSGRAYTKPSARRVLYRRAGDVFILAHHSHQRCASCGGYSARGAACAGCGARLAAA